ncbi:hypothetical protein JJL45_11915 [Tamlana sp. s12]|uniref:hypothetical protein n=1 Tax=Tamlana sp. s12 TaxID=1630406 RepID=UPI00192AC76C|nr:hypothetical protein [Tamlana sp. s12]QQY81628.1 hypothetical protein JJL45_11915 [Tamlana sp. s12]
MKILNYYRKALSYFSIIALSTLLSTIITGSFNMGIDGFFHLLLLIICLSIFIGTIFFTYDKYVGPKLRVKKIKTTKFTDFLKVGFKTEKDYLIGKINGYTVIIGYNWRNSNGSESLITMILFDPRINGEHLNSYFLNKWQESIKDDYNYWEYGRLFTDWPYGNGTPKLKSVLKKLDKNTKLISRKGLKKIEYPEWKKEIENYISKVKN